jgi:hypothetical protein
MEKACRTLQMLNEPGPPKLLVSLPANDVELAKAALDGGAAGLKVHINITHAAAGVHFGSLAQEAATIERIVALGLPVGIVPGDGSKMIAPDELARLAELGLDFCDVYLSAMPAWLLSAEGPGIMVAVGTGDMLMERLASLAVLAGVHMIEASIIPHDGYGHPLSVGDLCDYTTAVRTFSPVRRPVIVPTQRRILPDDLPALAGTGIRGLLIGAIVTGKDAAGIESATRLYAEQLSQLS